jgi:hypothetical protein
MGVFARACHHTYQMFVQQKIKKFAHPMEMTSSVAERTLNFLEVNVGQDCLIPSHWVETAICLQCQRSFPRRNSNSNGSALCDEEFSEIPMSTISFNL